MTTHAPYGVILFVAWVSFLDTSHGADAISHRSPDKKFALLTTEGTDETRFHLVSLPDNRKLLELRPEFGASVVLTWAPDSRRFAVCDDDFDTIRPAATIRPTCMGGRAIRSKESRYRICDIQRNRGPAGARGKLDRST